MIDDRTVGLKFREPMLLLGRFTGNATSNCVPVAGTKTPVSMSLVRTGVGAHTLTLLELPVGIIQSAAAWVASPTQNKLVQLTPFATLANNVTNVVTTLLITNTTNGAVDLTASEEIDFEVWCARSPAP